MADDGTDDPLVYFSGSNVYNSRGETITAIFYPCSPIIESINGRWVCIGDNYPKGLNASATNTLTLPAGITGSHANRKLSFSTSGTLTMPDPNEYIDMEFSLSATTGSLTLTFSANTPEDPKWKY